MPIFKRALPVLIVLSIAACATEPPAFVRVSPQDVTERIAIAYRSVEIRRVTLPTYAASEEIYGQTEAGILESTTTVRWADVPDRAITLELTRNLAQLTRARVASEPWPFQSEAEARVEVRFEDMLAGADGVFSSSGQYFVMSESGRERSDLFSLQVAYDPTAGPDSIARARATIILDLAKLIASKALR